MKTAILLHGKPSKKGYYDRTRESQSNEHWFPWLQHELIIRDVLTQTPEWPRPFEPDYEKWLELFSQFKVDKNTILIGHSCGAGFLLRWLSENQVKVGKVILVAPSLNPIQTINGFYDFKLDPEMAKKTKGLVIYYSDDDDASIQVAVSHLNKEIKDTVVRQFHGYGHFIFRDMHTRVFPELLEEALKE